MKNVYFFDENHKTINFFYFFKYRIQDLAKLPVINSQIVQSLKWHQKKGLQLQS
jgi:hypothetical protein